MFRTHQQEFQRYMDEWRNSQEIKDIYADITPGGGKSLLPVMSAYYGAEVDPDIRICWVVPKLNLANQAERSFMDKRFQKLIGHKNEIRHAPNDIDPCRGTRGYVTTYSAIAANPGLHEAEFRRHKYILHLDEPHHLDVGGAWAKAIEPLADLAILRIYMSGTFTRWDGKAIFRVPYIAMPDGRERVDYSDTSTTKWIRYSIHTALVEKAIIEMHFERFDGNTKWKEASGKTVEVDKFADAEGTELQRAIYTALDTEFATELLWKAKEHWRANQQANPRAKLLVIAANIRSAKRYHQQLLRWGVRAGIATSEERLAEAEIHKLRKFGPGSHEALVTVAMAYEGMDCPPITHIAFLTHIRSKQWILQALARATRVDPEAGPPGRQFAVAFAPDDEHFTQAIADIRNAQDAYLRARQEQVPGGDTPRDPPEFILPIEGQVTAIRATGFDDADSISGEDYDASHEAAVAAGLGGMPLSMLQDYYVRRSRAEEVGKAVRRGAPPDPDRDLDDDDQTVSGRERRLRTRISELVNRMARGDADEIQRINTMVIKRFGKTRPVMSLKELEQVWLWLSQLPPVAADRGQYEQEY
jgi:superfamily II DNA or RNA helicase